MKFRNDMTGEIFNSLDELFDSLCHGVGCYFCKMAGIGDKDKCKEWSNANKEQFLYIAYCSEVPDKSCYTCEHHKGKSVCRLNNLQSAECSAWKEKTE